MDQKGILEAIECHMIFGEVQEAEQLKNTYDEKYKISKKKDHEMMIKKNQTFEGTLIAAGWDHLDHVTQLSLYTEDDEDILLERHCAIRKFAPYMNQEVRVLGDVTSSDRDGRRITVKKISKLLDGLSKPAREDRGELNYLFPLDAA